MLNWKFNKPKTSWSNLWGNLCQNTAAHLFFVLYVVRLSTVRISVCDKMRFINKKWFKILGLWYWSYDEKRIFVVVMVWNKKAQKKKRKKQKQRQTNKQKKKTTEISKGTTKSGKTPLKRLNWCLSISPGSRFCRQAASDMDRSIARAFYICMISIWYIYENSLLFRSFFSAGIELFYSREFTEFIT